MSPLWQMSVPGHAPLRSDSGMSEDEASEATNSVPHGRAGRGGRSALTTSDLSNWERGARVPRRLWFLWLQGLDDAPELIQRCHGSWVERNPGWSVEVLTRRNLRNWLDGRVEEPWARELPLAQLSDVIRLELLVTYGGVWVDATCFCSTPLDNWLFGLVKGGLFSFSRPGPDRLLASWFLASAPANPLLRAVLYQLSEYWKQSMPYHRSGGIAARVLEQLVRRRVISPQMWFHPFVWRNLGARPYFAFHYMVERVIQDDVSLAALWWEMPKVSADGPHRPQLIGLDAMITASIRASLVADSAPVYKLTWKRAGAVMPGSVLDWVLNCDR